MNCEDGSWKNCDSKMLGVCYFRKGAELPVCEDAEYSQVAPFLTAEIQTEEQLGEVLRQDAVTRVCISSMRYDSQKHFRSMQRQMLPGVMNRVYSAGM